MLANCHAYKCVPVSRDGRCKISNGIELVRNGTRCTQTGIHKMPLAGFLINMLKVSEAIRFPPLPTTLLPLSKTQLKSTLHSFISSKGPPSALIVPVSALMHLVWSQTATWFERLQQNFRPLSKHSQDTTDSGRETHGNYEQHTCTHYTGIQSPLPQLRHQKWGCP